MIHRRSDTADTFAHSPCRARGGRVGLRYSVHGLNHQDLDAGFDLCPGYALMRLERSAPQRLKDARRRLSGTGRNRSGCHIASIDTLGGAHDDRFSWHDTRGDIRREPVGISTCAPATSAPEPRRRPATGWSRIRLATSQTRRSQ